MIADLKPYAEYKDSGQRWLGNVPGHWGQRRMKFLFKERVEKGFPDEPLLAATQSKGVVLKEDYGARTVAVTKDFHLLKLVETGDFVISLRSFQGGIELAHCRGIISPAYTILTPRGGVSRGYYAHFFKSANFVHSLTMFVTGIREGQNIDYERMSRASMPLPPIEEQIGIGQFLDWANGRLERAIRAKRKVIALLNEQKQAIIHRAVTRGLDPSVPLKPSGIPWLGDIPIHWEIRRAKYLYREVDERSASGVEELLSVSHLTGVTPRSQKNITMFRAASYVGHKICQPGDLVVNTMWAWMGALGVSTYVGIISPAYAVYRPQRSEYIVGAYMEGLLRSRPYVSNIICRSTGLRGSRLRLYPEEFFRLPIIQPPTEEQWRIVGAIQVETGGMNTAISRLEREIELLREYRTRLVADVVTGRLDVREAATRLPVEHTPDTTDDDVDLSEEIESANEEAVV
jgi:type I restriction enzyme, S subunit